LFNYKKVTRCVLYTLNVRPLAKELLFRNKCSNVKDRDRDSCRQHQTGRHPEGRKPIMLKTCNTNSLAKRYVSEQTNTQEQTNIHMQTKKEEEHNIGHWASHYVTKNVRMQHQTSLLTKMSVGKIVHRNRGIHLQLQR